MVSRNETISKFLVRAGWGSAERWTLAGDASFRRYDRLRRGGENAVLMDAPPPQEDVRPFLKVTRVLHGLGLSAPRVFAEDAEAGLLLLEDLGDDTYTRLLAAGHDEERLYALAIDALAHIHKNFAGAELPPYDDGRLLTEASLLVDWYMPAVRGRPTEPGLRQDYVDTWKRVLPLANGAADTLVLRDYHVDNMMLLKGREGVAACGLVDYQDAVIGPAAYDLVSLLEDARRDVPERLQQAMLDRYFSAMPATDREKFMTSYAVLGAQRNAKIFGIFTRLCRRDGKPQYLRHIPRVWRLLEGDLRHPALAPVRAWLDRHLPPATRLAPSEKNGV
jgi:aminoglycoside/choline kinase family phosphotransferase